MCSFIVLFFRASRKDPELDILYYNTQSQFTAWIFLLPERLQFSLWMCHRMVIQISQKQQVELAVNIWNLKVN